MEKEKEKDEQRDKKTNWLRDKQKRRPQTYKQAGRHAGQQADGQTFKYANRRIDSRTNRLTNLFHTELYHKITACKLQRRSFGELIKCLTS